MPVLSSPTPAGEPTLDDGAPLAVAASILAPTVAPALSEANAVKVLRRVAVGGLHRGELDRWLSLCYRLSESSAGERVLPDLLASLRQGQLPRLSPSEPAVPGPLLWLPRRNGTTLAREVLEELTDRVRHRRGESRVILPSLRSSELDVGTPVEPRIDPLDNLLARERGEPLTDRLELDLTESLREFEAWVQEERRRRVDAITARAVDEAPRDPLTLQPASPERTRRALHEAVALFNQGRLDLALFELEVALSLLRRAPFDTVQRRAVLMGAQRGVDASRLDELVALPEAHSRLRQFLRAFPQWSVQPLIDRLAVEPERKERRRLLDLLVVHGSDTRRTAAGLLLEEATAESPLLPWYLTRNLLFLLRRLVEREEAASDLEMVSVLGFADLRRPPQVVTEAVGYLSRVADPRSEGRLLAILGQLEKGSTQVDQRVERALIERLLRMASPKARARAVEYLCDRARQDSAYLGILQAIQREDLKEAPEVRVVLRNVLREEQSRGWRRFLSAPRRSAALERTLRRALEGS